MCLTTLQVEGYTGDNYSVFATDGLFFHSGLEAASVVVWNMDNRQEVGRLEGHDEEAFRIIAARGNIAVSNHDGGPRLWNLQTLQCTATAPAADMEGDYVNTASITGSKLLQGYEGDHGIKVWDIAAAEPIALADLEGHTDGVGCIKSSAVTALSGSGDATMRLWDLRTSKCVRTMEGHTGTVYSVDMDGQCVKAVSGSFDESVKLWDLGSGRCMETYEGLTNSPLGKVVMHESGKSFLSSDQRDYIVRTWAVGSTKARMTADFSASFPPDGISHLFASRDLSRVAYCCISPDRRLELRYWK